MALQNGSPDNVSEPLGPHVKTAKLPCGVLAPARERRRAKALILADQVFVSLNLDMSIFNFC